MRTSFRFAWAALLAAILALGLAQLVLLQGMNVSWMEMAATVLATVAAVISCFVALKVSRVRRDRMRRRQVFICYPTRQKYLADEIATAVRADGFWPFLASAEGAEAAKSFDEELRHSGVVLMLRTSDSGTEMTRNWIAFENEILREARGLRRGESAILPVIAGPVKDRAVDPRLSTGQYLNIEDPSWRALLNDKLARVFGEDRAQPVL